MNAKSRAPSPCLARTACVFATFPLFAASGAARAEDSRVLEEIVITATKRVERLQDVPISVSAITSNDIAARGFSQYADYLNSVPGVFFQDSGPGKGTIRIRGVSGVEGGVPSTTATYFGESVTSVLTNQGGKPNLRLVDIERVEVLRGPQGTLFGADALAGVVRIIPAAPQLDKIEGHLGVRGFSTTHSSEESYHAEGVLNLPLIADRLAARVVAYGDSIGGYIDNVFPGQEAVDYSDAYELPPGTLVTPAIAAFERNDIDTEETWGVRAALRWMASEQLTIDLTHVIQDVQLDSEPFVEPGQGDFNQRRGLDVFRQGDYGERLELTSLVGDYSWESVALTAISSWTRLERFANQDVTFLAGGLPIPWLLEDQSQGKLFTQEVRVQSRGEGRLQWLAGVFYLSADSDGGQRIADFSCPTCMPTVFAGQDFAFSTEYGQLSRQEQRSVFGQASYRVAPRWTVGVGARYLEADLRSPFPALDGILSGGAPPMPTVEGSDDEFNPSAYVRFEPTANITTYAQASRGFRSGQANQALPDACVPDAEALGTRPMTEADTLWSYELGMKSRLADDRLVLNAAIYRHKWSGVQLVTLLACGFSVLTNGGEVEGQGAEIELVAEPFTSWRMNVALAYNDSEFESVVAGTAFSPGDRLQDAPRVNTGVGLQRTFQVNTEWSGFVRGDYNYVGNVLSQFGRIDAFDTTSLRVSLQRSDLALELFGRNIFDERGVVTLMETPLGPRQTLIRPREIGVEIRYQFQ